MARNPNRQRRRSNREDAPENGASSTPDPLQDASPASDEAKRAIEPEAEAPEETTDVVADEELAEEALAIDPHSVGIEDDELSDDDDDVAADEPASSGALVESKGEGMSRRQRRRAGSHGSGHGQGAAPVRAPSDSADADAPAEKRKRTGVFTFIRHCAEELRRVQWPDRAQVFSATAVVLGFVVIAGTYLGLMDALWDPVVKAII